MDSFMHKHQSALDSQREEAAIKWRFPEPDNEEISVDDDDDYELTDYEMMSSFGTKWHDYL